MSMTSLPFDAIRHEQRQALMKRLDEKLSQRYELKQWLMMYRDNPPRPAYDDKEDACTLLTHHIYEIGSQLDWLEVQMGLQKPRKKSRPQLG
jgi:hypothetical protein